MEEDKVEEKEIYTGEIKTSKIEESNHFEAKRKLPRFFT